LTILSAGIVPSRDSLSTKLSSPVTGSIGDRAILAVLLGCGLRRSELIDLTFDHIQRREDHWAIVDLVGKAAHVRTVPLPDWVKETLDHWLNAADIRQGKLFRCVCRKGTVWGTEVTEKVVWHVVKEYSRRLGISKLAPHDLRRSCARFCHDSAGELEQIQFLLGHVSVQTTEKYLGCKQRLREAVNDRIGIEPCDSFYVAGIVKAHAL
jgi:integrase